MDNQTLTIVFHSILRDDPPKSTFDMPWPVAYSIIKSLHEMLPRTGHALQVFLDDGLKGHDRFARLVHKNLNVPTALAIVTGDIGSNGYLTIDDLLHLQRSGIHIASHGVSHAALGKYNNNTVLPTPKGGEYRNMPRGRLNVLSQHEIEYQIQESAQWLTQHHILAPAFVYPYGIYNQDIRMAVERSGYYMQAYSCDPIPQDTTSNPFALPRIVIDSSRTQEEWIQKILSLTKKYVAV